MSQIGKTVRALREERGITQEELAAAMGVQQAQISHIEHGVRAPSLKVAIKLANFFGVTFLPAAMHPGSCLRTQPQDDQVRKCRPEVQTAPAPTS